MINLHIQWVDTCKMFSLYGKEYIHESLTMTFSSVLKLSVMMGGFVVLFGLVATIVITKDPLSGVAITEPWISTTGLQ